MASEDVSRCMNEELSGCKEEIAQRFRIEDLEIFIEDRAVVLKGKAPGGYEKVGAGLIIGEVLIKPEFLQFTVRNEIGVVINSDAKDA